MKININLKDAHTYQESFTDSEALKQFLTNEYRFWAEAAEYFDESPPRYFSKVALLQSVVQLIEELEGHHEAETKDQNQINSDLQSRVDGLKGQWIWSNHPRVRHC